ncbi:MAG: NAD(P) transhydrogenase subunit alpha [Verrucomicrobiota bacterium]|nr:NAD(P) transhydrogenase subunit alpha [Verrucomicrobiota bacterium]
MKKCILTSIIFIGATSFVQAAEQHAGSGSSALHIISLVFVFMLATFIGLDVIKGVSRLLHTPLMSLTNAISAISVVGAIIVAGHHWTDKPNIFNILGLIAVVCSVTNIVSGFLITNRMLKMFKSRDKEKK